MVTKIVLKIVAKIVPEILPRSDEAILPLLVRSSSELKSSEDHEKKLIN